MSQAIIMLDDILKLFPKIESLCIFKYKDMFFDLSRTAIKSLGSYLGAYDF